MSTDVYSSPLSERYASKDMQYIFSPDMKFRTWRRLWIALAEIEKDLGLNITQEQIDELKAAMDGNGSVSEEAGDLLFAIVNVVRLLDLDGEQILHDATDKFIARFGKMEELAASDGLELSKLPLSVQDSYWEKAKKCLFTE